MTHWLFGAQNVEPAGQMHRLALVRGINTAEDDHGRGAQIMLTGRKPEAAIEYPHVGAVMAKLLANDAQALPGHMHIVPGGGGGFGKQDATFLGPKFASVTLGDGKPPADLFRPGGLTDEADRGLLDSTLVVVMSEFEIGRASGRERVL